MLTPEDIQATSNDSPVVDCADTHTAETFAVGEFPSDVAGEDLDDPALGAHVFEECEKEFGTFLGGNESLVMRATVTWAWFRPSEEAWEKGARWWRCDVVGGGEESTELVELPGDREGHPARRPGRPLDRLRRTGPRSRTPRRSRAARSTTGAR